MGIATTMPTRRMESAVGAQITIDGQPYINFGGSSYLGLSSNPEILAAGIAALRECGAGTPIPRDHFLATRWHLAVETEAVTYFRSEAALYLAGGYYFGLIAIAALRGQIDAIFFDELAHYSLREAIAASAQPSYPFRHLDAADLDVQLRLHLAANDRPLIVTDGMYSSYGRIAPLDDLWRVAAQFGGRMLVDESHSFGVLGATGRGAVEQYRLAASVLSGGSLGKAFGACGGIIPATEAEVAAFRTTPACRGATAGLPAAAAMSAASLRHVRQHPELLQRLRANTTYMKAGLRRIGLDIADSIAPVAGFVIGSRAAMQALQRQLMSAGIFVYLTTYVGSGTAGAIRCAIFADHTQEHMDRLLDALERFL